jgi:predicted dehydrogenase
MAKRLKSVVISTGFMGRVHLEQLQRVDGVDVVAVAGRELASAQKIAAGYGVQATDDYRKLLQDSSVDAVHVCTPNATHYQMVKDALQAGKKVLCEKPVTTTLEEAQELLALTNKTKLRNCVWHNLCYYPMVQQMRRMRESDTLEEILVAQGTYSQDWMLYPTDWNWRVNPKISGASRGLKTSGRNWFDMIEHLTGLRVKSQCADFADVHPTRKKPKRSVETFTEKFPLPRMRMTL